MRIFTPIYGSSEAPERLSFLRPATTLFNFGQKTYQVEVLGCHLYLVEGDNKPSWVGIAVRVALIMTGIVPLIALAAAAIYRLANKFYEKDHFTTVLADILNHIFRYADLDALSIAKTCRRFNAHIKPSQILSAQAFKECLSTARFMKKSEAGESLCKLAKKILPYNLGRARDLLDEAEGLTDEWSKIKIVTAYAKFDLERALSVGKLYHVNLGLIKKLIAISQTQAQELLEIALRKNLDDTANICRIALLLKESRYDEAFQIADGFVDDRYQLSVSLKIIEILSQEEALARANCLLELAESKETYWKNYAISTLIKIYFAKHDRERAIELGKEITKEIGKESYSRGYDHIAREWAKINLEEALVWAERLKNNLYVLIEIAETIHKTLPEKAREVIEYALINCPEHFGDHYVLCAGAMARIDEERALEIAGLPKDDDVKMKALNAILQKTASIELAQGIFAKSKPLPISDHRDLEPNYVIFGNGKRFERFFGIFKAFRDMK